MWGCRNSIAGTPTVTITSIACLSDNAGTTALTITEYTAANALVGTVAASFNCSQTWAAGSLGAVTTIPAGYYLKFSVVSDGATKTTSFDVEGTV